MSDVLDRPTLASPAIPFSIPTNRWNDSDAAGKSDAELLLYRSNLLGSDLTVTNFGGGNTSAKIDEKDPLTGGSVTVLWVKGSGGDIGSMKLDGFSTVYLDKLLGLEKLYRGLAHEDEMVGYLPHTTFNLNNRAASIDTPLHGYLPFAHVDHVHPDAIIALAAAEGGQQATKEIWGGEGRLVTMAATRLRSRAHAARLCCRQSGSARRNARGTRNHLLGRYRA